MNPDQLSKISQEYILVRRPNDTPLYCEEKQDDGHSEEGDMTVRRRGTVHLDDKEQKPSTMPVASPIHLALHRANGGKRAMKPIQAWLSYYAKQNGAANTAFATSYIVRPNLDVSWASWQQVFDEFKVLAAECIWQVSYTTPATVQPNQTPNAIMVYEPSEPTVLASVNAAMEYEHFSLCSLSGPGGYASFPISQSKAGVLSFKVKIPGGVQTSAADPLLSSGQWRPTIDASNYYWGSFQGFVAQGGVTSVLQQEVFIRMRVEFRTRR
jgi:hypothetical protein